MKQSKAIESINRRGALLVFPIQNRKEPPSLWGELFPRSQMRWEWDDSGDSRVANLWHLREELSRSNKVVYSKWFRGRATFFSRELFVAFLALLGKSQGLSKGSLSILQTLEEESPLSTKALKKRAKLQGQALESTYHKALKPLWVRGLIVGYGEVDEGAFPSLAIGSTQLLFEDLWLEAHSLSSGDALKRTKEILKGNPMFFNELQKQLKLLREIKPEIKGGKTVRGKDLYLD